MTKRYCIRRMRDYRMHGLNNTWANADLREVIDMKTGKIVAGPYALPHLASRKAQELNRRMPESEAGA